MSKSGRVNAFYQGGQLVTELGDDVKRSVFRGQGHFLGHLASGDKPTPSVSAVDRGNTVMAEPHTHCPARFSYTPYGDRARRNGPDTPWAYHGERLDTRLDGYLLGNGYRLYRPALMRFGAPDNMGPFGQGMLNPYAYCMGDPVNQSDPSGHFPVRVLYKYAVPITIAASLTTVATGTALAVVGHLKKDNKLISAAAGLYVGVIMLVGTPAVWGIAMSWRRITSSFMTRDRPRAQTATRRESISRSTRQSLHPNQPPVNSDLIPYVGSTERSLSNRNSGPPEHIELQHINNEVRQPETQ
ncbi:RHS repeat-associated core domain-containing protein [Pseudomonas putida]|uniref:RHS repeat-associated core domain-containing protein n=1 Tax=Pseudomonas putida TaxID=303 RepID=UPI0018E6826F|nr:RHS repeat-associated core domain-containing protein [Pseudomonas putida]